MKGIKEKCKSCTYCKCLNIYKRSIETIGGGNIISGFKIGKSNTATEKALCCVVFFEESGEINEVDENDMCEFWKEKTT